MSDFNQPCNDAEVAFLEGLAREHPKDIRVIWEGTGNSRSLKIEIDTESIRTYVVWMLADFRKRRNSLEDVYNIPDWEYE